MTADDVSSPRKRSRYAPDRQVKRAIAFALEYGLAIQLGADGSVAITGRLDPSTEEDDVEAAFQKWKRQQARAAEGGWTVDPEAIRTAHAALTRRAKEASTKQRRGRRKE